MRIILIGCMLIGLTLHAQRPERRSINPEEFASIQTKKITLALDLSDSQAQQVYPILLEKAKDRIALREKREELRKEGKRPSQEERASFQKEALDKQITAQRTMKSILNADQYELWRKHSLRSKAKRRGKHGKGHQRRGRK